MGEVTIPIIVAGCEGIIHMLVSRWLIQSVRCFMDSRFHGNDSREYMLPHHPEIAASSEGGSKDNDSRRVAAFAGYGKMKEGGC